MPQFDFATFPAQIFWACILFFIQYLLMSKVIVPGFKKVYELRQLHIDTQVELASQLVTQAEQFKHDYEKMLLDAKTESAHQMNVALHAIQKKSDQQLLVLDKKLAEDFKHYELHYKTEVQALQKDFDKIAEITAQHIVAKLTDSKNTIESKFTNRHIN
jgi:F-type H+-transporting ATPase subunit b